MARSKRNQAREAMSTTKKTGMTRRRWLKLSTAASAAALAGTGPGAWRALAADQKNPAPPAVEKKYSSCDMCFNKCGLVARVEKGKVAKLGPNPHFLKSRGMLCARGNAGIMQLYDPDRLKYPLLRKGARGEGKWQRINWDQALDLAAAKLKEIGEKYTRCGTVFMAGTDTQSTFVHRFAEVYGSYNVISHESNCLLSRNRAFLDTFGVVPIPDTLNCRYIIMPGANRFEALVTPDSIDIVTALQNGAKLVVLDPRYTKTAALASEWHAIRPGTDMAFFLAVANVLITEGLYDKEFVAKRTHGFKRLAEHVRQYTPQWAAAQCDIPAIDIIRIARELAQAAPAAMVYPGRRSSDYVDSTQIRRSMAIVNALIGNWDQAGGLTLPQKIKTGTIPYEAPFYDSNPEDRVDAGRAKMMFPEEGSFKYTRDAVIEGKPYPVKGFFTYKTNPMQTGANQAKTVEMISQLDFMITVDIAMSDTAWMADLVLPAPTYLEREDPVSSFQGSSACSGMVMRDPVVPAMYQSRPVFWIIKELAGRLGLEEHFDFTIADFRAAQLKDLPQVTTALKEQGVYNLTGPVHGVHKNKPFRTRSTKVELYNDRYKENGVSPLPVYRARPRVPQDRFRMVVGRNAYISQSSSTNNALLAQLEDENTLWINPEPAARLGITSGQMLRVASPAGAVELKARVTQEIRPDTVYMDTGFGPLSTWLKNIYGKGACLSRVLKDEADEVSGNMAMHETLVTVEKVRS
ncbi:MAG: molybdopterin-dependent oxidoreductase [Desulfarculaceae bacterium]|nr:molybdopterin-dependent oxidoreductase [Desulfarculaceae bacterium]MCF8072840.1 molybdopterin-dependent oxidoreductase [Desulfarculaceae bacterium]MCF8101008.1 molybdopterin-dependent oxidoreductase [Desulfarculaceae bacterium]MCF8115605.1 molybdopterin-dependent oxidoreductase [Desulfarculaceae bacterium]